MRVFAARDIGGVLGLFENKPIYEEGTFYADGGDCWVLSGLDGESPPETFCNVAPGQCFEVCLVVGEKVDDYSIASNEGAAVPSSVGSLASQQD